MSVMTADFWLTRMAIRNDIVQLTIYNPPHQISRGIRHLSLLVRIGTTITNNTSEGAMMR
jgi:hypothetical protein